MIHSRQRLWEPKFKETVFSLITDVSYTKAADYTNILVGRDQDKLISRTLNDQIIHDGSIIEEYYSSIRCRTLQEYGFNPDSGVLEDRDKLPDNVVNPRPKHSDEELEEFADKIAQFMNSYNNNHDIKIKMPLSEIISSLEYVPEDAVIICIDEVGVKHQKEYRKDGNKEICQQNMTPEDIKLENAENVETAVAYIRCAEGIYRIAEKTIKRSLLTTLAFLLSNNLMSDRELLFFTDGAKNLKRAIESIYSFRPYTINLDWIHVKKYCYQLLTMALKGGKENLERNENIRTGFFNYLWVGDIQGSKDYLDSIDISYIKNAAKLKAVKDYLNRKSNDSAQKYFYCYAARKELGLINSSNQGEKSNDIIVAQRQKHNGMSWCVEGSSALGHIKQIRTNEEAEYFYKTGKILFRPVELTEEIRERYSYGTSVS